MLFSSATFFRFPLNPSPHGHTGDHLVATPRRSAPAGPIPLYGNHGLPSRSGSCGRYWREQDHAPIPAICDATYKPLHQGWKMALGSCPKLDIMIRTHGTESPDGALSRHPGQCSRQICNIALAYTVTLFWDGRGTIECTSCRCVCKCSREQLTSCLSLGGAYGVRYEVPDLTQVTARRRASNFGTWGRHHWSR